MNQWTNQWMNQWMDGWKCNLVVKSCRLRPENGVKWRWTGRGPVRRPCRLHFLKWFIAKIKLEGPTGSLCPAAWAVILEALLGVTLHNLGWLRRHLGSFWCFNLNDFGPCSKRHVLSQSISMMSCNVTVKLGRIHKDSDGSERIVCIRVCICICVCILYTAGCELLMESLQEKKQFRCRHTCTSMHMSMYLYG